jgi:hypothetical protein
MKHPSTIVGVTLLVLAAAIGSRRADAMAVIVSADVANSTITISEAGGAKLYHLDPLATVYLDGAESSIKQLTSGMTVDSVSLSDPSTISEIKVTEGAQPPPSEQRAGFKTTESPMSPDELAALTTKLENSYWFYPEKQLWFYLGAGGKVVDVWHNQLKGNWTLGDRRTLLIRDTNRERSGKEPPMIFPLNTGFTKAGDYIRLDHPTPDMAQKVAGLLGQ